MRLAVWIFLLLSGYLAWVPGKAYALILQKGTANLSEWSRLPKPHNLELAGKWKFYWQSFYTPAELKNLHNEEWLEIPGAWASINRSTGYATYFAKLQLDIENEYALYLPDVTTAGMLFVNGEVIWRSGQVGRSEEESQPARNKSLIRLPKAKEYELVLWVSNFEHHNGGVKKPIRFGLYSEILKEYINKLLFDALVVAAILAIGIYHLVLSVIRKDIMPMMLAFLCKTMAVRASITGMRIIDFFFDLPFLLSYKLEYLSFYVIAAIGEALIYVLFHEDYPKKIVKFRLVCHLLNFCIIFLSLYYMSKLLWVSMLHCFGVIVVFAYVIVKAVQKKRVGVFWLAKGSLFLILISLFDIFQGLQVMQKVNYLLPLGFIAFILSFSASIAQIYKSIYEKLLETQEKKKHTLDQLKKIVYPHQIEMIDRGRQIEDTMPTGRGEACVMSFDIIRSSEIQHDTAKTLFRNVFARCYEHMMEGYDGLGLKANAYRIKEMGDGFLCSVGFPFDSISGNMVQDALELSYRFIDIFHEEAQSLKTHRELSCSIGLAFDFVEGFYPATGTKEYDLYGRSIILATRYESMRKAIIRNEEKTSIIILQERVYECLTEQQQEFFEAFDLTKQGTRVRDDPNAKILYYRKIPYPHHLIRATRQKQAS